MIIRFLIIIQIKFHEELKDEVHTEHSTVLYRFNKLNENVNLYSCLNGFIHM